MKNNHSWGGRMKSLYILCLTLILACLVVVYADYRYKCNDLYTQLQIERAVREKETEDLKKDIRLIKTDLYIIQYGYEEER